jgi:hypothetical protein
MTNVQDAILDYLRHRGRGQVYTSKDLVHLGNRAAVDQTVSRLARDGSRTLVQESHHQRSPRPAL